MFLLNPSVLMRVYHGRMTITNKVISLWTHIKPFRYQISYLWPMKYTVSTVHKMLLLSSYRVAPIFHLRSLCIDSICVNDPRKLKAWISTVLQWHNFHTKFYENPSGSSAVAYLVSAVVTSDCVRSDTSSGTQRIMGNDVTAEYRSRISQVWTSVGWS
jgi:hypothetical protein